MSDERAPYEVDLTYDLPELLALEDIDKREPEKDSQKAERAQQAQRCRTNTGKELYQNTDLAACLFNLYRSLLERYAADVQALCRPAGPQSGTGACMPSFYLRIKNAACQSHFLRICGVPCAFAVRVPFRQGAPFRAHQAKGPVN